MKRSYKRKCTNGDAGLKALESMPPEAIAEIHTGSQRCGMLLGDVIADMTKAIGIPPCGGCEKRRQWLNTAHQWVRDYFSPKS